MIRFCARISPFVLPFMWPTSSASQRPTLTMAKVPAVEVVIRRGSADGLRPADHRVSAPGCQCYGLLSGMRGNKRGTNNQEESTMIHKTIIGIDLAKHVFQVCI